MLLLVSVLLGAAAPAQAQNDCDEGALRAAIEALPPDSLVSRHRFAKARSATIETREATQFGAVVAADCPAAIVVSRWSVTRRFRTPTRDLAGNPLVQPGGSIPMGSGIQVAVDTAVDVWALRRGRARRIAASTLPHELVARNVALAIRDANGSPPAELCFGDRCFEVRGRRVAMIVVPRAGADQSTAATVGSGEWMDASHALGPQAELRASGAVAAITGSGPERQVRLAGGATFSLRVPSGRLPFANGDAVDVHIRQRSVQIHRVVDATIRHADGRLLLAMSGGGDPAFAPGFTIEQGPIADRQSNNRGAAERRTHQIIVRHTASGRTAIVPPNEWRRLTTPDGTFLITGHAVTYGQGTLLPDSSEYLQYALVRAP